MDIQQSLSVLNEEQYAAVVHEGSPLLILAGAGSGKTRVITTKIAYLINQRNAKLTAYGVLCRMDEGMENSQEEEEFE